jgi:hypothetical protein
METFSSKSVFIVQIKLSDVLIYTINSSVTGNSSILPIAVKVAEAVNVAEAPISKPPDAVKVADAVKEAEAFFSNLPELEHDPLAESDADANLFTLAV